MMIFFFGNDLLSNCCRADVLLDNLYIYLTLYLFILFIQQAFSECLLCARFWILKDE